MLVRPKEERPLVWQGRRELDHMGFGKPQYLLAPSAGANKHSSEHTTGNTLRCVFIMGGSDEANWCTTDSWGSGTTLAAAELTERVCYGHRT
ncbi:MAG TPA: hypothetical protein VNX70_13365 [Bryobacteraceae bacterium]|nr:hypothetical protein [Bryobacteraceae bacterium]